MYKFRDVLLYFFDILRGCLSGAAYIGNIAGYGRHSRCRIRDVARNLGCRIGNDVTGLCNLLHCITLLFNRRYYRLGYRINLVDYVGDSLDSFNCFIGAVLNICNFLINFVCRGGRF